MIEIFRVIIIGICGFSLVVVLVKSNIAYYMNIPKLTSANISFNQINDSVQKYEKRVKFDPYEITYRYSLHLEYEKYLDMLKLELELDNSDVNNNVIQTEYKKTIQNMENNLLKMQNYNRYDDEVLLETTENIISYIEEFVCEKYEFDKEAGYSFYLDLILKNIECISKFKYNEQISEAKNKLCEYCREKIVKINLKYESEVLSKYINILEVK